jgi:N,N'-diacetyllegionaminate synthase
MRCFVIAEAGVNHNGSEARALDLVEAAARAGADAVKFQTFRAERLVAPGTQTAAYQAAATGESEQLRLLRGLELSEAAHQRLRDRCRELGIEFMSTPFDEDSVDLLCAMGVRRIKIPSGEITNLPLLRHAAAKGLPLIVSTGMADLDEVAEALDCIQASAPAGKPVDVSLLHCTSAYPAACEEVNLRAMETLRKHFGVPVGYSDHTRGLAISIAAVAQGAVIIEKHFTLDRTLPGPDHAASLEPDELSLLVQSIRDVEVALGDGIKRPMPGELAVRALVRRSVVCIRALPEGHVLQRTDVALMRPGTGIHPRDLDRVVGRRLRRPTTAGQLLSWEDLDG